MVKPSRNGGYDPRGTEKKQEEGKKRGQEMKGSRTRWQVLGRLVRSQGTGEGRKVDPALEGDPSLST